MNQSKPTRRRGNQCIGDQLFRSSMARLTFSPTTPPNCPKTRMLRSAGLAKSSFKELVRIGSIVFLLRTVFKLYLQSNYVNLTSSDGSWVTSCGSCLRSRYFLIHSKRGLPKASWGNKNGLSGEVGGDHQLIMWRQKKVGGVLGQWNSVWFPSNGLQNLSCKYELSIAEWEGLIFSHPDELWRNINQCLGIAQVQS